jgi:hypothetical protein
MLKAQSTIKPLHSSCPHTCWVRQVLTIAINNVAQKEEASMKMLLVLGVRNPQSTVCEVGAFVFRIKHKSLIIFLFLTWYCFCIHLYVTICMKLDPSMHIGLHLVFFGKTGVTDGNRDLLCSPTVTTAPPMPFLLPWDSGELTELPSPPAKSPASTPPSSNHCFPRLPELLLYLLRHFLPAALAPGAGSSWSHNAHCHRPKHLHAPSAQPDGDGQQQCGAGEWWHQGRRHRHTLRPRRPLSVF